MTQRAWIIFSGSVWFIIGALLLYKGILFVSEAADLPGSFFKRYEHLLGSAHQAANLALAIGLSIGFLKGRFVLAKTVQRVSGRIAALPLPISFGQVYSPSYWLVIGSMMGIGFLFRFLAIPIEIRGVIDVAIGSALITGSFLYFKAANAPL